MAMKTMIRQFLWLSTGFILLNTLAWAQVRKTTPTTAPAANPATATQAPAVARKAPSKDEVFFTLARRIGQQNANTSPSALVSILDGFIEIKEIAAQPDGKMIVTVQERAPSNAAYTQKSARLKLAPATEKDKWMWEEFEEAKRFYPVEKIFPYTQNDLNKKKQNIAAKWANLAMSINKQCDAAIKALDTAKAVIKTDPPMLSQWQGFRAALNDALKNNDQDALLYTYRDMASNSDGIVNLADTYPDLKTNDAYLRLIEEFKGAINGTNGGKRDYVETVKLYNDTLVRLPFALVASGIDYVRIEPKVEE
jgi:LemA protein